MLSRAFYLFVAGACGGLLAWAICEPFVPHVVQSSIDDTVIQRGNDAWMRFEFWFSLAMGSLIGLFVGGASGLYQGSKTHVFRGAGIAGVCGGILGTAGISIGSKIYGLMSHDVVLVGEMLQMIGRGIGWGCFGAFVGAGVGAIGLSGKRVFQGAMGGLVGGTIGGILFQLAGWAVGRFTAGMQGGSDEVGTIPRAIGALCVGASIGLLVGIVEALSRQAWIRVILGRNEGKEYLVDQPQTFLGRNETAQVPLMGDMNVAPMHACIQRRGDVYVLMDGGSPVGTLLNGQPVREAPLISGSQIRIGSFNLEFHLKQGSRSQKASEKLRSQMASPVSVAIPVMPAQTSTPTVSIPVQPVGWTLVAMSGPLSGQRFPVSSNIEIGRDSASIPLGFDTSASRRHASFVSQPTGLLMSDLGSTNGTFVHEQRVASQLLQKGDLVRVGITTFRVE